MRAKTHAIILLEDYASGKAGVRHLASVFKRIHAPLGVYAVQGNREHWTDGNAVRREREADGIRMFVNENVVLRKGKTWLALTAIDDTWTGKVDWEAAYRVLPRWFIHPQADVLELS